MILWTKSRRSRRATPPCRRVNTNLGRKLKSLTVTPGSAAAKVLDCLRRGVVDPVAIADELDMITSTAAMLKGRLIKAEHWRPEGGEA